MRKYSLALHFVTSLTVRNGHTYVSTDLAYVPVMVRYCTVMGCKGFVRKCVFNKKRQQRLLFSVFLCLICFAQCRKGKVHHFAGVHNPYC